MREQGVNLASLRQKICLGDSLAVLILAKASQEPFELLHIAIARGTALRIEPVAPADFVEGLGTAAGIDPPCEGIDFAAAIAIPGSRGCGVIDHLRDIEGHR